MDPTTVECSSACTVTIVHEMVFPPFNLTVEEAAPITVAILVLWSIGFAVRMLIRALNADSGVSTTGGGGEN